MAFKPHGDFQIDRNDSRAFIKIRGSLNKETFERFFIAHEETAKSFPDSDWIEIIDLTEAHLPAFDGIRFIMNRVKKSSFMDYASQLQIIIIDNFFYREIFERFLILDTDKRKRLFFKSKKEAMDYLGKIQGTF